MGDLKVRLQWLMGLRVLVVTLLLGLTIWLQAAKGQPLLTFYGLTGCTYAITIVYAFALKLLTTHRALTVLAYVQVVVDLLLETVLVASTGAAENPFSVLYMITVVMASLILGRQGGLMTAGLSVLLLGLVTSGQLYGVLSWIPPSHLPEAETLHSFSIQGLSMMAAGLLSGALAEQLKRADQSLIEKERGLSRLQAFHENVVESLSSGVFTTDAAGCVTSFNRAAQEITRYPLEAVYGRPWSEVFAWQQVNLFDSDPAAVTAPHRFEGEARRADGSRLVLGMTLAPLTENGVRTGLVGIFQDLTKVRDLEEEMRRREWLATLGEVSAGMAHEIRNPLAALAGAMQILKKDLRPDESNERLMDIAIRETARLDAIITEFLLYARPPALNLKECDLNTVVTEVLDLIRHEAQARVGIVIVTDLAKRPLVAQVDPDQMKQVFWNLATNAFEAMPTGGELVLSTTWRQVDSGGRSGEVIEISFRDTGEGIKREALDKIFLPFFTTKKRGSGLGLAAVHRIVDLHGGWIRVESQEKKGSEFVVCLPVSAQQGLRLWHEGREPWKRS